MSSPQKSQLKILIANDLGASIEDRYEGQMKAAHEIHGAAEALKQAAVKVPGTFIARIDKDLEEGKIGDMTALEVAEFVKKQLSRTGDFLAHLAEVEAGKAVSQFGRAQGVKDAMNLVSKMRSEEQDKLQRALSLVEDEVVGGGPRPQPAANAARAERGSARERKAQAQAEKDKPKRKLIRRKKTAKKANG